MENVAELIQRLLEIQSGESQRSPALIAEDQRLMDGLQKTNLEAKPSPTAALGQDIQNGRDSTLNSSSME